MATKYLYDSGTDRTYRVIPYRGPRRRQYGPEWCYFWFVGWTAISLGLHVSFSARNIEIHIPFGFIRIGDPGPIIYESPDHD